MSKYNWLTIPACLNILLIGDWICSGCANDIGIDVGIEGQEWEIVEGDAEVEGTNEPLELDDRDDDEIAPVQRKQQIIKRKIVETLESDDSESEEDGNANKRVKSE
mgnify:CR=1 FL=1